MQLTERQWDSLNNVKFVLDRQDLWNEDNLSHLLHHASTVLAALSEELANVEGLG